MVRDIIVDLTETYAPWSMSFRHQKNVKFLYAVASIHDDQLLNAAGDRRPDTIKILQIQSIVRRLAQTWHWAWKLLIHLLNLMRYCGIRLQSGRKEIMSRKKISVFLAAGTIALLLKASTVAAYTIPYPFPGGDVWTYLLSDYFNEVSPLTRLDAPFDFTGEWEYTAIASEAGNWNTTEEIATGPTTFSNQNISNWGLWNSINFDSANLFFSDSNGPINMPLDVYNMGLFRGFVLQNDSDPLSYLPYEITLEAGTFIVGFNDNGNPSDGDSDFDDMVIALRPVNSVPEPSTMLLLGAGLLGLGFVRRRKQSQS